MISKNCSKCKLNLEVSLFSKRTDKPHLYGSWCKICIRVKSKEHNLNNKLYFKENYKKKTDHYKNLSLIRDYGIDLVKYNQMFVEQSGCCKICNVHQSDLKISLAVDHCHTTGKVRGLLCGSCNRALGLFKDEPEILLEAARYLNDSR